MSIWERLFEHEHDFHVVNHQWNGESCYVYMVCRCGTGTVNMLKPDPTKVYSGTKEELNELRRKKKTGVTGAGSDGEAEQAGHPSSESSEHSRTIGDVMEGNS